MAPTQVVEVAAGCELQVGDRCLLRVDRQNVAVVGDGLVERLTDLRDLLVAQ